jgi:hypothetical protein
MGKQSRLLSPVFVDFTPLCEFQLLCLVGAEALPLSVDEQLGPPFMVLRGVKVIPEYTCLGFYFGGA